MAIPHVSSTPTLEQQDGGAVVVVDPISTGAKVASELVERGTDIICVWSEGCPEALRAHVGDTRVAFVGTVEHRGDLAVTVKELRELGTRLQDVICGCETGVEFADELSEALGLRTNGTKLSKLRRNKYLQAEAARADGLVVGAQALAKTQADVEAFLAEHKPEPFKLVVKPVDGAGSEGVHICDSPDAVRAAFASVQGSVTCLGHTASEVLLMEYLGGDEYVVDTVSRDGVHKCVAIWKYDKRRMNGAEVVYFGTKLLRVDDPREPRLGEMAAYALKLLGTLGIGHGAAHTELKVGARGPVLIEVNCRTHGGDGCWAPIAQRCLGYTQVTALCDAYLDGAAFAALPALPRAVHAYGAQVDLRSAVEGTLSNVDHAALDRIRAVPSFIGEFLPAYLTVGGAITKTVDVLTVHGEFNLAHADEAVLRHDYDTVQSIIDGGLFEVSA